MNKIKVVGIFVFALSLVLVLLFNYISTQNRTHTESLSRIYEQKSYTQEISKSIFYLSKNRGNSSKELEGYIHKFIVNMKHKKDNSTEHIALVKLWKEFYLLVQKFQKEYETTTLYSSILTDTLVNNIYMKNQDIIVAFDRFITSKDKEYEEKIENYKNMEYMLFFIVVLLLMYLFTQIREVIYFIHKFTTTSKNIMQKASIKGLKPMVVYENNDSIKEATQNFNYLVGKIDTSIIFAQESIKHTTDSLEDIEKKIENFMMLLTQMEEKDNSFSQKEDTIIDSLETLMNSRDKLKDLQKELGKLTFSNNNH